MYILLTKIFKHLSWLNIAENVITFLQKTVKSMRKIASQFYRPFFFFFFFFRAPPTACGESQVRGRIQRCSHWPTPQSQQRQIWAASVTLHHSSRQCQILNPLNKARNQAWVLLDTSQICFHWATMGSSHFHIHKLIFLLF